MDKTISWKQGLKRNHDAPAANASSANDDLEDEEPAEDDGEGGSRDKGKGVKYAKMKKMKQLPSYLEAMIDGCDNRAEATRLINKLLLRNKKNGELSLNLAASEFEKARVTEENKFEQDQSKGYETNVMIGMIFSGQKSLFEAALAAGELMEFERNGKVMCGFEEASAGSKKCNKEVGKMTGPSLALKDNKEAELLRLGIILQ